MLTRIFKNNYDIINILIAFYPISYALGNLILSLNTILIAITGIFLFRFKLFVTKEKIFNYLIYFFFFYLIFITIFNNINSINENTLYEKHIIKSFLYLRYLLLFLVVAKLTETGNFNVKYLFFTSMFMSLFLAIDIIVQYFFGQDLFGIVSVDENRRAGFFGDEFIAGGYLQIFSFFLIFSSVLFSKNRKILVLTFLFFTILLATSILLTGNRMPFMLFIMGLLLFAFLERRFKKYIITFSFIFLIISTLIINNYKPAKDFVKLYYAHSSEIVFTSMDLFNNKVDYEVNSHHLKTFNAGIDLWKQNKVFGSGLKSFRINCKFDFNKLCNTHPHNYYIELLLDVGLIGTLNVVLIFLIPIVSFIKNNYISYRKNLFERITVLPFFLTIFAYAFPIKSSGSFFTTTVSTFIFLFLAILIHSEKVKLQN